MNEPADTLRTSSLAANKCVQRGEANQPAQTASCVHATWQLVRLALLLLACPPCVLAQPQAIDPPIAGRPLDFSNIVGRYAIQASATPTDVCVEEPITLRITITGDGPQSYQPKRESLRLFPKWDDDFYVQEMRAENLALPDKKTWLFVYRLRPKHTGVSTIDGIKLVFYNPDKPGRFKFETRRPDPIAIVVKAKPEVADRIEMPLAVPESFYQSADASDVFASAGIPFALSGLGVAAFLAGVPLLCLVAALAWRRRFPDAIHVKERQRSVAAKRALAQLQTGEPARLVLHCYLRERLDFAVEEPTPVDVASFLRRRGFARDLYERGRTILNACDAAIYASHASNVNLIGDATQLIHALEADPCARR